MKTHRVRCYLWFLCFLGLVMSVGHAQNLPPTHPIDGEYIKEWLVLGPIFPDNLETDFLADVGGEAKVNPKAGDTVTTADGRTNGWNSS